MFFPSNMEKGNQNQIDIKQIINQFETNMIFKLYISQTYFYLDHGYSKLCDKGSEFPIYINLISDQYQTNSK